MTIDFTDWAALLEALDGIRGPHPEPPPLPTVAQILAILAAKRGPPPAAAAGGEVLERR